MCKKGHVKLTFVDIFFQTKCPYLINEMINVIAQLVAGAHRNGKSYFCIHFQQKNFTVLIWFLFSQFLLMIIFNRPKY